MAAAKLMNSNPTVPGPHKRVLYIINPLISSTDEEDGVSTRDTDEDDDDEEEDKDKDAAVSHAKAENAEGGGSNCASINCTDLNTSPTVKTPLMRGL